MIAPLKEEGREEILRQSAACMQHSELAWLMIEISWKQMRLGVFTYMYVWYSFI